MCRTKAGELLARKRPVLIPIFDDVIRAFLLRGARGFSWELVEVCKTDTPRARRRARTRSPSGPSTLRLVDVPTWMRCGNSAGARNMRLPLGLPTEQLPA